MMISHQQLSFAASSQAYFIPTGQVISLAIVDLTFKPHSCFVHTLTSQCTLKHVSHVDRIADRRKTQVCVSISELKRLTLILGKPSKKV